MPSFIPRNSPTLGQKTAFFTGIKRLLFCTVLKEKDKDWRGKYRERIYWFRLLGVVTRSLEGCNPCPHVTHGSGMRRSPCDPHGMQSLSPNRHIWGCHATPRTTQSIATEQWRGSPSAHFTLRDQHTFVFAGIEVPATMTINITLEATLSGR